MAEARFDLFRYQLLPIAQAQLSLFDRPISREELVARKNAIFRDTLLAVEGFMHARGELIHEFHTPEEFSDIILVTLAVGRTLKRETRDFDEEVLDTWPRALVVIHNRPDVQKIAIQRNPSAFQLTSTVVNILERTLLPALQNKNLSMITSPIFDKESFWEVVRRHPVDILRAEFRMISPNMSNISRSLAIDLAAWARSTNTQETTIQLQSDPNNHLTLSEGDPLVNSMVEYASEGGGDIEIKIRGFSKTIRTEEQVTEIAFDEAAISAKTPEEVQEVAKLFAKALE